VLFQSVQKRRKRGTSRVSLIRIVAKAMMITKDMFAPGWKAPEKTKGRYAQLESKDGISTAKTDDGPGLTALQRFFLILELADDRTGAYFVLFYKLGSE